MRVLGVDDVTIKDSVIGWSAYAGVYAQDASPTLDSNQFRENGSDGLTFVGFSATKPLTLNANTFISNTNWAAIAHLSDEIVNVNLAGNSSTGSANNGFGLGGTISGTVTYASNPGFPFILHHDVVVEEPAKLTLTPGTGVKLNNYWRALFVNGSLVAQGTAAQPIFFTSTLDDTHGGDTNGDGDATSPAPVDWGRIEFASTSHDNVLQHVWIGYGGGSNLGYYGGNVRVLGVDDVTIRDSIIGWSAYGGVYVENASPILELNDIHDNGGDGVAVAGAAAAPRIRLNRIHNNKRGIAAWDNAAPLIHYNILTGNTNAAVVNASALCLDAQQNYWGDPAGPNDPSAARDHCGLGANNNPNGAPVSDNVNYRPFLTALPIYVWIDPPRPYLHGVATLRWATLGEDAQHATASVDVKAYAHDGAVITLGTGLSSHAAMTWDTGPLQDGWYELRAIFRDASGQIKGEAARQVLVNNAVNWHSGRLTANETWGPGTIHVVDADVILSPHVTLTVQPGAIVKFVDGTGITIEADAVLNAPATAAQPIICTALADDSAGNDTNLDGDASAPLPGSWNGFTTLDNGQVNINDYVEMRYIQVKHAGALTANETWSNTFLHLVTADVIVPAGKTLTLQPGAMVKLEAGKNIIVQAGGHLHAPGTLAQPIVFTSIKDDEIGGDSNHDGSASTPAPGDWMALDIEGEAALEHVIVQYGGGSATGGWNQSGMIRTRGASAVSLRNCIISDGFYDGILVQGGTTTVENCVITGNDRGLVAWLGAATAHVINSTFDDNRIGLVAHGGVLTLVNSLVTNSIDVGILHDIDPSPTVRYTDVWSPNATHGNYQGLPDQTGSNGNISANPKYKNPSRDNYRLNYVSPAIDAADGAAAPANDFMGAARYDDPRTANTGTPAAGGAYADMGAYEFVETADSKIDLAVSQVSGPSSAMAGDTATVHWTVVNRGAELAIGPWHDTISLVSENANGQDTLVAGEILVGENVSLGTEESVVFSAEIRVPGGVIGNYHWQVETNSRGDVFEGRNRSNNSTRSTAPVALDLPELVVDGTSLTRHFATAGESHWFKFTPQTGQDVLVTLDLANDSGITEVYVAKNYMPTREKFDARYVESLQADVSVVAADTSAATYYVLAYPASLPDGAANFEIQAKALHFGLRSVSPTVAGNTGPLTLALSGGQLSADMTYELVASDSAVITPTQASVINSSLVYATFNLIGRAPGVYDVRVRQQAATVTLDHALTIEEGGGPQVWVDLVGRDTIRIGRAYKYEVTYGNKGNVDAVSGLVFISGVPRNAQVELGPKFAQPNVPEGLDVDPQPPTMQAPDGLILMPLILPKMRPGASGSASFTVTVPTSTSFDLELLSLTPSAIHAQAGAIFSNATHLTELSRSEVLDGIPAADRAALQVVWNVLKHRAILDNVSENFLGKACVGVARDVQSNLYAVGTQPGSALNGWTIHNITMDAPGIGGAGFHTTTLVTSPDGQRHYLADNYTGFVTIIPMYKYTDQTGTYWRMSWINWLFGWKVSPYIALESIIGNPFHPTRYRQQTEEPLVCKPVGPRNHYPGNAGGSFDPNEKVGTVGVGEAGFIAGESMQHYRISFENKATAMLPAQQVMVSDVLAPNLDLTTVQLGAIGFNHVELAVPPNLNHYEGTARVTTDPNPVHVEVALDAATRTLTWIIRSVDPLTGDFPEDPFAGFLPPNNGTGQGEGFVDFSAALKPGLLHGDTITNSAQIVFDVNPPIATNTVTNTVDLQPPTSTVAPLPAVNAPFFPVRWSGSDGTGAGIVHYDIYVSKDGGPFRLWQAGMVGNQAIFSGEIHSTYRFYSVATDKVGNVQPTPTAPQASTTTYEALFVPYVVKR